MNATTAKQHYVPQFYLRRFLSDANTVEVLDCDATRIVAPRGTKGICYERYFYGLQTGTPDEVSQRIEQAFSDMEDGLARELDRIVNRLMDNQSISDTDKWLVAQLMSLLWIRGPAMRTQVNRMAEDFLKQFNVFRFSGEHIANIFDTHDRELGTDTPEEVREEIAGMMKRGEYTVDFNNAQHLQMFESINNFANLFWAQYWTVYISLGAGEFITSDNPVAVVIPERKGFYGAGFLERTHHFALSPEIMIVGTYADSQAAKKLKRRTLFKGDEVQVMKLNMIIAGRAQRYAYARSRTPLESIVNVVRRDEEHKAAMAAGHATLEDPGV